MYLNSISSYTDFSDLAALRREATAGDQMQALEQAARQFEAVFMQMMLKTMREASDGEGLFDNEHSRLYQDMFDKQLTLNMSQADNGIGLAKILVQQLKSSIPALAQDDGVGDGAKPILGAPQSFNAPSRGMHSFRLQTAQSAEEPESRPLAAVNERPLQHDEPVQFESPQHFVETLWPHAKRTAEELGVDPRAIIAQAALETGWGRAVIRHPDGSSSHNLFNIKADHRWDGERVSKLTLEYRDGVAAKEHAWFRSYNSFAESFADYARFLQKNGRYHEALQSGQDAALFSERLQEAGYATDPAYASKIQRIINSEPVTETLAMLKNPPGGTLI